MVALWISGASQSLQSTCNFLLLITIPSKIKNCLYTKPLGKIGLREMYRTLNKNELGLLITQLEKGSPFENQKFLFELKKKERKRRVQF